MDIAENSEEFVEETEKHSCSKCGVETNRHGNCLCCNKKELSEHRDNLEKMGTKMIILHCLNTIQFRAGRTALSKVLKGNISKTTIHKDTNYNPYYGALKHMTFKDIIKEINTLIPEYIEINTNILSFNRPVLILNLKGKKAVRVNQNID